MVMGDRFHGFRRFFTVFLRVHFYREHADNNRAKTVRKRCGSARVFTATKAVTDEMLFMAEAYNR